VSFMNTDKLNAGQKHVLSLINRDRKADGWTTVSKTLFATLSATTPVELATFEATEAGGRVKLTEAGQEVVNSMAWL
jgi:hypothetical protein